jgi:hypothetical protein
VCSFYLFVNRVWLDRKRAKWPLCVFIGYCNVYCGVGVIWQPSCMCDVTFVR